MEPLYWKVNRDLTLEVAQHAKVAGVKQFIFMSSQIVFHESQSLKAEILTAETEPCPNGFYGGSKWEAEKGLWKMKDDRCTMKICVLRPPMIYGPNAKGNFHVWLSWQVKLQFSLRITISVRCCISTTWLNL